MLEARYKETSVDVTVQFMKLHGYWHLIVLVAFLLSYVGNYELPVGFWVYLGMLLVSLVFLVLCSVCRRYKSAAYVVHTIFVCAMAAAYSYMIHQQTESWQRDLVLRFVPSMALLPVEDRLYQELWDFIPQVFADHATMLAFQCQLSNLVSLSVVGLNSWTLGGVLVIWASLLIGILTNSSLNSMAMVEMSFIYTIACLSFILYAMLAERVRRSHFLLQVQLAQELQASQMADSVLNHTLKNTLADVAACLELHLAGAVDNAGLADGLACLRRGMKQYKERHVYLKVAAHDYVPVVHVVNLAHLGQELVAGRTIATQLLDVTVLLDTALLNLILENAISNAFKHGHTQDPDVWLTIDDTTPSSPTPDVPPNCRRFVFAVSNAANPQRPRLTDAYVQMLFAGKADPGVAGAVPPLSDRAGLAHCMLAAAAGGIRLTLGQAADRVTFTATVTARLPAGPAPATPPSAAPAQAQEVYSRFPSGLTFYCLDDSRASLRLLEYHILRRCQPATVLCLGAEEADVERFTLLAANEADVVILDQHLIYSRTYYGTDIARALREMDFRGLICIRSANDSADDRAKYAESGAHCSFGKDVLVPQMLDDLKAAYVHLLDTRLSEICAPIRLTSPSLVLPFHGAELAMPNAVPSTHRSPAPSVWSTRFARYAADRRFHRNESLEEMSPGRHLGFSDV